MNNRHTGTVSGFALILFLGVLSCFLYTCIDSDMPQKWFIALLVGCAMIVGIIDYAVEKYYDKRKQKNNMGRRETGNRTGGLLTRALLRKTLDSMSLKYKLAEDQRFVVKYQGETFLINADDDDAFIYILDGWWYDAPLDDIDNLSVLYKAINEHNIQSRLTKIAYTNDLEENKIEIHTLCGILWIDSIPNIEAYLQTIFDNIIQSHQLFFQMMEEERRKDFAKRQY